MITVKTTDLFNLITDMIKDGYPFTTVEIIDAESDGKDDYPASLHFECPVDNFEIVDFEMLDDEPLPNDFDVENYPLKVKSDSYCMLPFTLEELTILHNGMKNGVQLLLDNLSETSIPANERSECSQMLKMYEPLIAKIESHFRTIGLKY